MTDFIDMTKAQLADLIGGMTASQIKKTSHADLVQMAGEKAQKPKARKPRELQPHVFCEPTDEIKAVKEGSKKHKLLAALEGGASIEGLMQATGWTRATVQSAFRVDVASTGFGVERRADQRYYLMFPANVKSIPVATADVSRAEALVAACR